MKVWRFPLEQLEKWLAWRERQKKWESAFAFIEEVTGIKPLSVNNGGYFDFVPAPGAVIPEHFTKPDSKGVIRPKRNHTIGKNLLGLWENRGFGQPTHIFFFFEHMGIKPEGPGVFRADEVQGQLCLVGARGWNPEDYGYEPVEI